MNWKVNSKEEEEALSEHIRKCREKLAKESAELDKKYGIKSTITFEGGFIGGGFISGQLMPVSPLSTQHVHVEGTDVWVHKDADLEAAKKELEKPYFTENINYKIIGSAMLAWIGVQMKLINKKYCEW